MNQIHGGGELVRRDLGLVILGLLACAAGIFLGRLDDGGTVDEIGGLLVLAGALLVVVRLGHLGFRLIAPR